MQTDPINAKRSKFLQLVRERIDDARLVVQGGGDIAEELVDVFDGESFENTAAGVEDDIRLAFVCQKGPESERNSLYICENLKGRIGMRCFFRQFFRNLDQL